MNTRILISTAALLAAAALPALAADAQRSAILDRFAAEAKQGDPGFSGFSAQRGRQLFLNKHQGGKAKTPSCTTCHGDDPTRSGRTRAGKTIEPMAVSRNPERFTDPDKVAKWFGRNCRSVLGRACTAREKGDFITFMKSQ